MHSQYCLDCCLPETAARTVDWTRINTVRNRGGCVMGGGVAFWPPAVMASQINSGIMGRPVARGGGSGGSYDPPQLPIPKILFHPLAILFHPLAILFHLSAILFHPLAILFHPSAILFHPLAILFHRWNMDDVTRAMSKGGVLVNVQEWGRFSN